MVPETETQGQGEVRNVVGRDAVPAWYGGNFSGEQRRLVDLVEDFGKLGSVYELTTGRMHHFDTMVKHTLANVSPEERVTLVIDIQENKWFREDGSTLGAVFAKRES